MYNTTITQYCFAFSKRKHNSASLVVPDSVSFVIGSTPDSNECFSATLRFWSFRRHDKESWCCAGKFTCLGRQERGRGEVGPQQRNNEDKIRLLR